MKERRQQTANECAMYADGDMVISEAIRRGEAIHGWLQGRFIQVYPGGRAVDYTAFVDMPAHVALIQGMGGMQ